MAEKPTCNGFCVDQARSCLDAASMGLSEQHRLALLEMAAYWRDVATTCGLETPNAAGDNVVTLRRPTCHARNMK